MTLYLGIDPGQKGEFAVLETNDKKIIGRPYFLGMPLIADRTAGGKKYLRLNRVALGDLLRDYTKLGYEVHFGVEAQYGMGNAKGQAGQFAFARDYGAILGIIDDQKLPHTFFSPGQWMKMVGKSEGSGKEGSIIRCMQIFPDVDLVPAACKKPSDGRADALLIAYATFRKMELGL